MNDFGFTLISLNTDSVDYNRLAYACALSIRHSQPKHLNNVTIFTDDPSQFDQYRYANLIDVQLYQGPGGMDSRSRIYDITPYEHTIFLDSDMLVLDSLELILNRLKNHYLYVASNIVNFKNEKVTYNPYRKVFRDQFLPDLYNAFTYFKKSDPRTKEFFNLVKLVTDHPREFIRKFFIGSSLLTLPTDEAFSLVAKILDIDEEITDDTINIIHLKAGINKWNRDQWTKDIPMMMSPQGKINIGTWPQHGLLHYVDKTSVTDLLISTLEDLNVNR